MTKSKSSAISRVTDPRPHPSHRFQGFRSVESKVWYNAYFHKLPVLKKRFLNLLNLPPFIQNAYRSWASYFQIEHEVTSRWSGSFIRALLPILTRPNLY